MNASRAAVGKLLFDAIAIESPTLAIKDKKYTCPYFFGTIFIPI